MKKLLVLFLAIISFIAFPQTQVNIGPQSNTFTGMIRGYHFTSPVSFNICALYVPPDAPGAAGQPQHIRVVRFNTAPPPAFPGTTNAFVQLFTITNAPAAGTVACNIAVNAGDIIGVYGARGGCINSYDGVAFGTTIMGMPTILRRSGMQSCPNAGQPMANIWSEINYNIGRIFMYYNCCPTPTITAAASQTNICSSSGTSVTILGGGATTYTWMPGNLNTTSITVTPTISTTYTLSGSTQGCTGSKTVAVNVSTTPTINTITNSGPVCQGGTISFSATATTAGTVTYLWSGPNNFSSNVLNPSITNIQQSSSGTYSLTVINTFSDGLQCQSTRTTVVAVVPSGTITVTPSYTLCQGTNLNLFSNATPAPNSYLWSGPTSFTSALSNPAINNVMPLNAGIYTVTAFYTSPTTTFICTANAQTSVQVVATSPNTVTASANNLCQYTTANINANAPGALGFNWTGPNNFSATTSSITLSNIQPVSAGTYYSTAIFAIGTVSCTTNGSAQINVVPVSPVVVTPTISVCVPGNVQLTSSASGAATYSWTGPNNFTSNSPNITLFSPSPNATGLYVVTASFNNGQLTCYNTNSTQVSVNPLLTFSLEPTIKACYNSPINIAGPAGATSYTWVTSNGSTLNTQNLVIPNIQQSQSGIYTLSVSLGPCITSQNTTIQVLNPISYTLTPNNMAICKGDSVKLVVGSMGGSENYAYVWTPSNFLGSPTGSVQYGHPTGTTIYNIAAYDIACPTYTIFHTFTLQVNQPPLPKLDLEKSEGCEPLCLLFDTKTQSQAAITTYDFGDAQIMQADSFYYCFNNPGIYWFKITSLGKNGCRGTYDYPAPITVYPKPHSDFEWSPKIVTNSDNNVTFYPTSKHGPIINNTWIFTGTGNLDLDTTNLTNPQRVFENIGKYPVLLTQTTDKGCVDTIVKIIEVIDEMTVFIPNSFSPNGDGINDVFNVKGIGLKAEGFSMELFDRWGHLMFSTKDIAKGWDGTVKGQIVQDGVYVYKIKAIGVNGEGKKEYLGHVTLTK